MFPSPLILVKHFFTKVVLESHIGGQADAINMLASTVDIGSSSEEKNLFQLGFKLKLESPSDKQTYYTGELHVVGIFRVVDNIPAEKAAEIVQSHGASVLFAAMRELLINITSRGPWPPVLLATFNFVIPQDQTTRQELEKVESAT